MTTAHSRDMLEMSAAAWTARAELLQRGESGAPTDRDTIYLTPGESAEDAAFARL
jgi:hypothetical protein